MWGGGGGGVVVQEAGFVSIRSDHFSMHVMADANLSLWLVPTEHDLITIQCLWIVGAFPIVYSPGAFPIVYSPGAFSSRRFFVFVFV